MTEKFWFNRMVEHWTMPQRLNLVEQVRRSGLQVVQIGNFGPMFYGLADDAAVERHWVGMPLVGVRGNLAYMAEQISQLKGAGARFVGQMSMAWHYGDHEKGLGLFGAWERIWTGALLGPAPCADPGGAQQRVADGSMRRWPIAGRPYLTYSGCICNPHWLATLKPMVRKAIELGIDGFNVHHNFENFCQCAYCQNYVRSRLQEQLADEDLQKIFGTRELAEVSDLLSPRQDCPADVKARFDLTINRATQIRRKEAFDEIFIDYGRSLKPDLLLAQWYHKYDFRPHDERSLLPSELWAKGEDYIWYSQGGHKGVSFIAHGYLADMGLPARFIYAAGGGRPFVVNKYDFRRWRLSIAEATAHHGAALGFHWGQEGDAAFALEDYYGPVIRYHRFLTEHEALLHPAHPWSQAALVYPRRGELSGEMDCLDALKRLGRLLEDKHLLFDMILDEQLEARANDYAALILPDVRRLSREEGALLRRFVEAGGNLVFTGETGKYQFDGQPYAAPLLADWQVKPTEGAYAGRATMGQGRVLYIPEGPWHPELVEVQKDSVKLPVYPPLEKDAFGQAFLADLEGILEGFSLTTDAPWFVRVRAWLPEQSEALVLHWVNYHQDEGAHIEVPRPTGPIQVACEVPAGYAVERVEWLYPEMRHRLVLSHEAIESRIRFVIPTLIVYGLSVLHLTPAAVPSRNNV